MQEWEYDVLFLPIILNKIEIERHLNAYGADHWELVDVEKIDEGRTTPEWMYTFKRPAEDPDI